jgi:hypothetical protein
LNYLGQTAINFIAFFCLISNVAAQVVMTTNAGPVTMADINRLPPFCKLIMVDQPGVHSMKDGKNSDILNAPQYHIAKNNPHIHHYCWALINKNRYYTALTRSERNHRVGLFLNDTDYVIQNSTPEWPYFHVMYTEQAEMLLMNREFVRALSKVEEALRRMPDYEKAYAVKSDIYFEMGDKKRSIAVAQEGLGKNPSSRLLRNRLNRLGVPTPAPMESNVEHSAEDKPRFETQTPTTPQQEKTMRDAEIPDATNVERTETKDDKIPASQEPKDGSTDLDEVTKEKNKPGSAGDKGTNNNPYCRFCP